MKDPIVEEVHRARQRRAAKFGHDIDAMFDDLKRQEEQSRARGVKFAAPAGRKRRPSKRPKRTARAGC